MIANFELLNVRKFSGGFRILQKIFSSSIHNPQFAICNYPSLSPGPSRAPLRKAAADIGFLPSG